MPQPPAHGTRTGSACPACHFPVKPGTDVTTCGSCGADHHGDCWREHGGCANEPCSDGPTRVHPAAYAAPAAASSWPTPPPAGPGPSEPRRPGGPSTGVWIAVALVAVTAIGGAVAAVLLTRSDDPTTTLRQASAPAMTVTETQTATEVQTETETVPVTVTAQTETSETEPTETEPEREPKPAETSPPVPATRYVAQLGSFRKKINAETEAERLRGRGVDADVLRSNRYRELLNGYWVVYEGPYETKAAARAAVGDARRSGARDAFARPITAE